MAFFQWIQAKPGRGSVLSLAIGALIFVVNTRLLRHIGVTIWAEWVWMITLLGLLAVIAVIGGSINGRPDGIMIDNRNRVSLSKFQVTLWTVLILSASTSAAAYRCFEQGAGATLDLKIPFELVLAMGISAISFAGTPLILSAKADKNGSQLSLERTADKLSMTMGEVDATGLVFGRADPALASWADMFRGDDNANAASADISKIQQFMISIGLVLMYGGLLWTYFASGAILQGFPPLDQQFIWLLGISHASYLAYKAAPHGAATTEQSGEPDPRNQAVG